MKRSVEARIVRFNRVYADKAFDGMTAYQTWQEMKAEGWFGVDIAKHFDVAQATVSEWNTDFAPRVDSLS